MCTCLFNNWFIPAMHGRTLSIKRLHDSRLEDLFLNLLILKSSNLRIDLGKWVLPTSCRFNSVNSCWFLVFSLTQSKAIVTTKIQSLTTETGAMHQNKSCPKYRSRKQEAKSKMRILLPLTSIIFISFASCILPLKLGG